MSDDITPGARVGKEPFISEMAVVTGPFHISPYEMLLDKYKLSRKGQDFTKWHKTGGPSNGSGRPYC